MPLLVPARPKAKAWVGGRSSAGIAGLNPVGGMDVCLLCVVRWRSFRRADHSSIGVLPSPVCPLSVLQMHRRGRP